MDDEASDRVDDPGRRESESLFRNKMSSKYLDDVIEQTGLDFEEAVEMIEREKKAIDSMESGFLHSLDLILGENVHDDVGDATNNPVHKVNALLDAADRLLRINQKANRAVSGGYDGPSSSTAYQEARKADQDRVKDILAAGKRLFENDLDAIEQQARAKPFMGGNSEAEDQAMAVFGADRKRVDSTVEADKTLRYVQKGVKKMTEGLSPEV